MSGTACNNICVTISAPGKHTYITDYRFNSNDFNVHISRDRCRSVRLKFGVRVSRVWMVFQLSSPGMFVASVAMLPSSFAMYACSAALASWWNRQYKASIFFVAIAALLGWPFAGLVGLPIAFDILLRLRKIRLFFTWSFVSAVVCLLPMLVIDSIYFGKLTLASLNIVLYNVFSTRGPDLYGTEPWTFYMLNGLLNFNIMWPLALCTPMMLALGWWRVPTHSNLSMMLTDYVSISPFYIWLCVFLVQPHKEERFLYPVYFTVALCAAISLDIMQRILARILECSYHASSFSNLKQYMIKWITAAIILASVILSMSRITALYVHYHAPLDVWAELSYSEYVDPSPSNVIQNVCVGKDWYRYPSSFFLPNNKYRLRFLQSEFRGILPAYYNGSTSEVHSYFNDANIANDFMFTPYEQCHYIFDLDSGKSSELEPNYSNLSNEWSLLSSCNFVDAESSHPLFRAFYIPIAGSRFVKYANLNILKRF